MLIAMAVWDTLENTRTRMTEACLKSIIETVDLKKHRLAISDNGSCEQTLQIYESLPKDLNIDVIYNGSNLGTAKAVNKAWVKRLKGEHCLKMDNDVVIYDKGWVDQMEEVFSRAPEVGILGLKRKDLPECPNSKEAWYKTQLLMVPQERGQRWFVIESAQHVIGTCQAYSSLLLDKFGYLNQMQGLYGFDDALASLRAHLLGFLTVFLPHIVIDHIDPGGTIYQTWKEGYASKMMPIYSQYVNEYKSGKRPLYYGIESD